MLMNQLGVDVVHFLIFFCGVKIVSMLQVRGSRSTVSIFARLLQALRSKVPGPVVYIFNFLLPSGPEIFFFSLSISSFIGAVCLV